MPRVYLPTLLPGTTRIDVEGDDAHHLVRVLRVRVGAAVDAFDGRGRAWRTRVDAVGRGVVTLAVEADAPPMPEPPVRLTLAVGLLKGDQMDAVVRDATVMGASAIVPLHTDHVVVPARAWREDRGQMRWHRVAVAAARQCGRDVVPAILPVTTCADLLGSPAEAGVMTLACVEPAAATSAPVETWRGRPRPAAARVLIGPEGGWSPGEVEQLHAAGAHAVSLGPRTLRAEAAPTVALTLLWSVWGW